MDIIHRESPFYGAYLFMVLLSLITFRKVKWVETRKVTLKKEIEHHKNYKDGV